MPIKIVRNDITKMKVDAIVNAANKTLLGGGGVDGAIHRAAGKSLLFECMKLGGCKTGEAKITGGHKLPCKYVIHTVGPVYKDGSCGEKDLLISCYRNSLMLALEKGCESVAFPLISTGVYKYPKAEAIRVAMDTVTEFLCDHDMTVYIVVFDSASFAISEKLFSDIAEYIDDRYVRTRIEACRASRPIDDCEVYESRCMASTCAAPTLWDDGMELSDFVSRVDESFSQMLLRKIDEKGMTDAQCYKKANIDRKLFSKIRSDASYRPSKPTAIAFAIALELTFEETEEMLRKAGFALSHSNKFDIIIEYFIRHGNYNIFEINEALFAFDQNLLGA